MWCFAHFGSTCCTTCFHVFSIFSIRFRNVPLAFAGATSLTYWATATAFRPRPKPLTKPLLKGGQIWRSAQSSRRRVKMCQVKARKNNYALFLDPRWSAFCQYPTKARSVSLFTSFAKRRPMMRKDKVGAKPVSKLPEVSSSPATISALHFETSR